MPEDVDKTVSAHYTRGNLVDAITAAIGTIGKSPETVTVDDLAPVDEFHIGGRQASEDFLDQLEFTSAHLLLDVGCGLGGASRLAAHRYGARITGIDLTQEFVETGRTLCDWVGLGDRVTLRHGSALAMPFEEASFDGAYMMHVGMNIADKEALFREVARMLKPGAAFGIFDIMKTGDGDITFPVPWATTAETSKVAPPSTYKEALEAAGFDLEAERNRRKYALEFFEQMRSRIAENGPPPLGLHILMGETAPVKIGNVVDNLAAGHIAPFELIARKPR